jgi:hypothetical protein
VRKGGGYRDIKRPVFDVGRGRRGRFCLFDHEHLHILKKDTVLGRNALTPHTIIILDPLTRDINDTQDPMEPALVNRYHNAVERE